MWTWSLNWGEITPGIVIGSCPMAPADLERIRAGTNVSAVLSLQHDACHAFWRIDYGQMRARGEALGLAMRRTPMRDFDRASQRRRLPAAVAALAALQAQGLRTYVHCTAGLGRAPLTVLAYLVLVEGHSPETAIGLIHRGRPDAVPGWEAFHGCRADLVDRHRARIAAQAYALYQARTGAPGDPQADWLAAEAQVLRRVLTARGPDGG